jgi:general secretion pathway protein H
MQAKEMGISFDENHSYQFYILENQTWKVITASDNIFRPRKLPLNIDVEIFLEGDSIQKNSDLPQLLILSSGEFTPFEIILTHKNISYKISGNIMGEITVETN